MIFCFSIFYRMAKRFEFSGFNQGLYYFIIQTLGSIILLISGLRWMSVREIIILSIFFKLGLFPFQIWFFRLIPYLPFLPLFLILTFQKLPLFLFLCNNAGFLTRLLFFLNLIIGSIFLFFRKDFVIILGRSSIYATFWMFSLYFCSFFIFLVFLINYFFFFFILVKDGQFLKWNRKNFLIYFLALTFLIGYPPFRMFFFKLYGLFLLRLSPLSLLFFVWIFTFIAVISYFYFFLNFFYQPINMYNLWERRRSNNNAIVLISLLLFEIFFI